MYPTLFTTPGLAKFAEELDAERRRQLQKWGDQRHRDGTSTGNATWAQEALAQCQHAADEDALTWGHILYEEFTEVMAETDAARLRAELIQVAAVCAAWVSDLDRRPQDGAQADATTPGAESGPQPRRFYLNRHTDVSGISGTGVVADGVLWPDGTASVRWRGDHPSVVFWDRGQLSVDHVHGHGGATEIVWLDEPLPPKPAAYTLHIDPAPLTETIRTIVRRGPGEAGMTQ
ncbi:hypothetical protein AW27_023650 [Streptomyces sp. PCS3-D2]|uniref:hypothetical protein n=1 Tax=Streptomyces sp. PCS3-D2 TaxID=1460244 RepID=UPI00272CC4E9|nr:hypothetical protein [Streptomyces sp. PCS3-D2]WKV74240.1 hypothetical protein AW27_023650 [Streptomyces sp. PCS3-D2]